MKFLEGACNEKELKLKLFGLRLSLIRKIFVFFSKMEALFYYLAVMGQVNRDEIMLFFKGE